jgi:hypothetical protein
VSTTIRLPSGRQRDRSAPRPRRRRRPSPGSLPPLVPITTTSGLQCEQCSGRTRSGTVVTRAILLGQWRVGSTWWRHHTINPRCKLYRRRHRDVAVGSPRHRRPQRQLQEFRMFGPVQRCRSGCGPRSFSILSINRLRQQRRPGGGASLSFRDGRATASAAQLAE